MPIALSVASLSNVVRLSNLRLARRCWAQDAAARPDMEEVCAELDSAIQAIPLEVRPSLEMLDAGGAFGDDALVQRVRTSKECRERSAHQRGRRRAEGPARYCGGFSCCQCSQCF